MTDEDQMEHARRLAGAIQTPSNLDRLDLQLYADRLARQAARLVDEMQACRLRIAWREIEKDARCNLPAEQMDALESLGIVEAAYTERGRPGNDDEAILARRKQQLVALAALQTFIDDRIEAL